MSLTSRPTDYWGDARKHPAGGGWIAVYRLPWKARSEILRSDNKPIVFTTESEALRAVLNHTHRLMCPHLTAGGQQSSERARQQLESLFTKGGNVGPAK